MIAADSFLEKAIESGKTEMLQFVIDEDLVNYNQVSSPEKLAHLTKLIETHGGGTIETVVKKAISRKRSRCCC